MAKAAVLQFFPAWQHVQQGEIERGGRLRIEYDMTRLSRCFTPWRGAEIGDITAVVRFHPRGEIVEGSVVEAQRAPGDPPGAVIAHRPAPLEISVPDDATRVEMWFHNFSQTSARCDAWDSRFGDNYWFDVGGPPPRVPAQPVVYRAGAQPRPDIVNVRSARISKVNAFPRPPSGPSVGKDIQVHLDLVAWVSRSTWGARAWIDVHVFDGGDALIHAETLTLAYTGWGPVQQYGFKGKIFQGATATPGSVSPRPDARKVHYRLYYEIDGQVFSDGVLHQAELPEDAVI
ncbi:DUF6209 family protein [Sorangium sp. So ce1335]|uniref:DUF6209 family protein n=1 Tax=Sorangium sp. So ce1335 TaxID=3133335 RepID=UPI003F60929D